MRWEFDEFFTPVFKDGAACKDCSLRKVLLNKSCSEEPRKCMEEFVGVIKLLFSLSNLGVSSVAVFQLKLNS